MNKDTGYNQRYLKPTCGQLPYAIDVREAVGKRSLPSVKAKFLPVLEAGSFFEKRSGFRWYCWESAIWAQLWPKKSNK